MTITTDILPERIQERLRRIGDREETRGDADFVLYWMGTAARGHENPALGTAIGIANKLGLPVFVYHPISESHPYASDRHHTFMLEGARDVQQELKARGIGYACHLQREGHRGNHLTALARRAAAVVTEDMPVEPWSRWTHALAQTVKTPVLAVDTDCVVPMRLVGRLYDRAYKYRNATEDQRAARIDEPWPDLEPDADVHMPDDLPFEPVDLKDAAIPDLVAACEIDHGVGPVPHTEGGAEAGYERWETFREDGLDSYHGTRNNPTLLNGVSRLSAYLHHGHISPFRLARQASARDSKGAGKFIDELITWREMAHHFCFYDSDYGTVDSFPEWAIETLREHASDPRPELYDWETLARAKTDDPLWNLCQRSLIQQGELHNNVRMTWSKKLLEWTPDLETALAMALDLNHRYALDGCDPNSYLGIQWTYGAFDRPYDKDRDIIGKVRPRDTSWHAGRIDMEAYESIVTRPLSEDLPKVAVIGAGLAGLSCARTLQDHGLEVEVFDKSRGSGGRASTRRAQADDGREVQFDHGAQYFTSRDDIFQLHVDAWAYRGVVDEWEPELVVIDDDGIAPKESTTTRWVGQPSMSTVTSHLAEDLDPRFGTRIERVEPADGDRWTLSTEDGETAGPFDVVVTTAPPAQSAELLTGTDASFLDELSSIQLQPTWALMLGFDEPLDVDFDAAFVNTGPLSWVARDSSKPGRDGHNWTIHASSEWSAEHVELSFEEAASRLLQAFADTLEVTLPETSYARAHRWRYAQAEDAREEGCLADVDRGLLACGDWANGSRIEGAFLSGRAAAGRILGNPLIGH